MSCVSVCVCVCEREGEQVCVHRPNQKGDAMDTVLARNSAALVPAFSLQKGDKEKQINK